MSFPEMKKRLDEELGKISTLVSENSAYISGLSIEGLTSSINDKLNRLTTSISENSTSIKELSSSINDSQASGKDGINVSEGSVSTRT